MGEKLKTVQEFVQYYSGLKKPKEGFYCKRTDVTEITAYFKLQELLGIFL